MDLNAEFKKLYHDSSAEVQVQYKRLQENRKKARKLSDMVQSVIANEYLNSTNYDVSSELLELTAQFLLEECKKIKNMRAGNNSRIGGKHGREDGKIHNSL